MPVSRTSLSARREIHSAAWASNAERSGQAIWASTRKKPRQLEQARPEVHWLVLPSRTSSAYPLSTAATTNTRPHRQQSDSALRDFDLRETPILARKASRKQSRLLACVNPGRFVGRRDSNENRSVMEASMRSMKCPSMRPGQHVADRVNRTLPFRSEFDDAMTSELRDTTSCSVLLAKPKSTVCNHRGFIVLRVISALENWQ
jgi:hypothetical protein